MVAVEGELDFKIGHPFYPFLLHEQTEPRPHPRDGVRFPTDSPEQNIVVIFVSDFERGGEPKPGRLRFRRADGITLQRELGGDRTPLQEKELKEKEREKENKRGPKEKDQS